MDFQEISEITIVAGKYQITSPKCFCREFNLTQRANIMPAYRIGSASACEYTPISQETELTFSLVCTDLVTSINDLFMDNKKIRNKTVKDCTIQELFTAIRAKTKESK